MRLHGVFDCIQVAHNRTLLPGPDPQTVVHWQAGPTTTLAEPPIGSGAIVLGQRSPSNQHIGTRPLTTGAKARAHIAKIIGESQNVCVGLQLKLNQLMSTRHVLRRAPQVSLARVVTPPVGDNTVDALVLWHCCQLVDVLDLFVS